MIQSLPITITVDQFLDWYPANSTQFRYELHNGFIKQMPPPTGDHELVIAFLIKQILLLCVDAERLVVDIAFQCLMTFLKWGLCNQLKVNPHSCLIYCC
jgi:Uma2 family endonuclease